MGSTQETFVCPKCGGGGILDTSRCETTAFCNTCDYGYIVWAEKKGEERNTPNPTCPFVRYESPYENGWRWVQMSTPGFHDLEPGEYPSFWSHPKLEIAPDEPVTFEKPEEE